MRSRWAWFISRDSVLIRRGGVALAFVFALVVNIRATPPAADEAGRPVFRNFRPTDYRGNPQVYGLFPAANGLVYLSSEQGINEYDGIRWRRLPAPVSMIFAMQADAAGRIWIGGQDQFGFFASDTAGGDLVFHSQLASLPAEANPVGRIRSLVVLPDGVYFSMPGQIVRWREGKTCAWPFAGRPAKLHAVGNALYAHVNNQGLLRLDGDAFTPICTTPVFSKSTESALLPLDNGQLLAVVATEGFFSLDPRSGALTPWPTPASELVRDARIHASARLRDGSFVFGTQPLGLLFVSADGQRVRRLDRSTGLIDNSVLSLAPDQAGGLWVGFNTGAARIELDPAVSVFDGNNGPPPGTIDCWGRHDGVLYAGAYDGLWRLEPGNPATGAGAHFVKDPRGIPNLFGIEALDGDTLLVGNSGLYRLGAERSEMLLDTEPNRPLCIVISQVTPGRVYLGGLRGLTVAQKNPAGGWTKLAEYLDLGDVHSAVEENDGTLLLGTYSRGFWRLPRAGEIKEWKTAAPFHLFKDCGLPDVIQWTGVFNARGGASLFTDKGSFRLDASGTHCVPDARFAIAGAGRLAIYPLVRSANGDGWSTVFTTSTLETDYPLGRFVPGATGETWQLAPAGALAEIGFAGAAVIALDRTPAGEEVIWARGYNNTVRLALDRRQPPIAAWRAQVRSLMADGRAQTPPAAGITLPLSYSREPIAFTFAAPNSGAGGDVRFQTRLLGYTKNWSTPSALAEVAYTNLEGGPFTLEVRAINSEGRLSDTASLAFTVAPPWYRRPLAYAVYASALCGAILAFIRWRLGRAKREQHRLEALVVTRTSELATARDAAESANRAKSAFLASMSHELRTPLNGVIGYSQVLQNDARLAPDQQERLRIVQSSGEHLLRMINDVLDLAKIEAGKVTLRVAPCALGDLLRDIAAAHISSAAAKGMAFHVELEPGLPAWVECDVQKLRQILDNLLGNAVKFTASGAVTLSVRRGPGTEIEFTVRDTGPGISAADQARLFHAFEQAQDARPEAPGAGLGLAISRALVGCLGGELSLTSAPGAGSAFSFSVPLPECAPIENVGAGRRLAGYEGAPRRVLIVDDHDINRRLLIDLLTPLGFICSDFAIPREAFERLASGDEPWPDLAIVDVRMAGLDGLEFTRAIRQLPRGPQLKVLLTSASVLSFNLDEGRRAGAEDFIAKPFHAGDLLEKVGRLLALPWRYTDSIPRVSSADSSQPLPDSIRTELREQLAQGDLEALRTRLVELRSTHSDSALLALDEAAARFDLPRLRALLA